MEKDDLNLEANPGQDGADLQLDGTPNEGEPQGDDPLDEIHDVVALRAVAKMLPAFDKTKAEFLNSEDIEEVRSEVKKIRAISNRKRVVKDAPKETPAATPADKPKDDEGFLSKAEFSLANQKKAISIATGKADVAPKSFGVETTEQAEAIQADILENWDNIRTYYTPRRGKGTAEDIFEDIKDAYAVFNLRRPNTQKKADITDLMANKALGAGNGGGKSTPAKEVKEPPRFNKAVKPTDWFQKKS